ncbi:zinc carboxypeptidase [Bacillus phage Moonbeam]|uniref:Carboxypeptidase n=1 Tax=Bacillus phage Moonbeam TaxID=1540091 RepID=A0A0A0RV50_9CAUD|nr:zinc carboxypeptidase [Bacillus phage Moonbeam]AIW03483.1 carboxypeptidase [Bacillus phage Moonbeam]
MLDRPNLFMTGQDVKGAVADNLSYWLPPTQPSTAFGSNGIPTSKDPEGMLNATYETLRNAHPEYISRINMGKSTQKSDGTATLYNVYRYELTPKNYTKTIILSSGTHGNEYTAFFTLWRFMYHLVNDWESHPTLMYIRHNVRLIVTPIINPWGFANNKRQNANLVDLNRNTDYLWQYITSSRYQPGGTNYKGPNPFSENESQYYKQTVDTYSNAIAAIDFHTIITVGAEHIVYTPKYMSQSREIFEEVIDWLYKPGNRIVDGSAAVPTLYCYAANAHGMTAANPEWFNGLYGGDRSSVEMTECLKYFGNIIIRACRLQQKATYLNQTEPQTTWMMYDRGVTTMPIQLSSSSSLANFEHMVYQFPNIRRYGVIKAAGDIKITVSAPCTVTINPVLYQSYHPDLSWTNTKDADTFAVTRTFSAAGTYDIPIKSFLNAFPTNFNETGAGATQRTAEAKFRLRGKTTAGTLAIERVRVELTQKSTNVAIPVKYVNYTGLEANPEGTDFKIDYPDPVKYIDDSSEE